MTTVLWGYPGDSDGKEPACNGKTQTWSLGLEDPLEKEMAIHSSIPAWRIPCTEEPGCSPWGCKQSDTAEWLTHTHTHTHTHSFLWGKKSWSQKNLTLKAQVFLVTCYMTLGWVSSRIQSVVPSSVILRLYYAGHLAILPWSRTCETYIFD